MNALLSVSPIIVESARLSLLNIKQQACPSILFKLDSKSYSKLSGFESYPVPNQVVVSSRTTQQLFA